jgi:hypothetical protein
LCFSFFTKLDKLFGRIKRMTTTPPPTLLITAMAPLEQQAKNYRGDRLAPQGSRQGQGAYRSGRDNGHHYNYNINNNGGK